MAPLTVVAVAVSFLLWRRLDLLALGEADAQRLGVRVSRTGTLVLAALVPADERSRSASPASSRSWGSSCRTPRASWSGPRTRALLPASAFLGAILVVATDTLARTAVPPQELPLGVVTSLIGVPCFLVIMRSLRARRSGL